MYKLAVFDMDGTLLDTLGDLANAANFALARMGHPIHAQRDYLDYIGFGPNELFARSLPEGFRDAETVASTRKIFAEYYADHSQDVTAPYPGIPELLTAIRAAGMKVAICSNKPDANVNRLAGFYFPGMIDCAVGFRDGVKPKPDPSAALEILDKLGVSPGETCYIGDAGVDVETGKNAGLFTVGVTWGFRPRAELAAANALVDSADELLKILLDKN